MMPPRMALSFSSNQSSSLKLIHQKKQDHKKTSVFRPSEVKLKSHENDGVEIKKLGDYLAMSSQANF